ncbi:MAG: succinylglutamate desuccinylase/aspartoacylase family protein [Halodesulfurarchaeum sp.]
MEIGTVTSVPGTVETGWFDVASLPTGGDERLPVLIAEGERDGPTVWVTGAIHGDEVTGIAAAQDVMTEGLAERIRGTVVSVPILNPAGVRTNDRNSYYHDEDPNRYFPYQLDETGHPPLVQQLIDKRLFERFSETADALVSLHAAWTNERPFTILERVRYGSERTREEAQQLADESTRIADAFGLPPIREYDVEVQESYDLQHSFECAALNTAGVPAITAELGSSRVIEELNRRVAVRGIRNVFRLLDVLPEDPLPNEAAPSSPVDFPVKRVVGPVAPDAGLVRYDVEPGDVVEPGDPVADVVSPQGHVESTVESDHEGYVLGRREGIAVYENDPLLSFVARDESELVVPTD